MVDRLTVEVVKHAAIYISEEMGVALRNASYSPNIKDRMDHTCAVLSPEGDLVAQAEHIPVHIGSMAVGVKSTLSWLEAHGISLDPGDMVLVNDPYLAGTHLNDLTMLMPVYHSGRLIAILANKAHHVDIGGSHPGSLGGSSRELVEEGLVIPPVKIVEGGRLREDLVRLIASNVRTPAYFKGDLAAQIASLRLGGLRLKDLAGKYGANAILESWSEILDYTERYTRSRIEGLGIQGSWGAEDYLEPSRGGRARIRVSIEFMRGGVKASFEGTDRQLDEPLNAVYGVTVASTTFALKTVIDPEMPVNQGFFRAVEIGAPAGSIVNPVKPAPVSGGNTETSQRIADVVFKALAKAVPGRVPAASCGTMTNVMIGGEGWAFYETIGCGEGARPWRDGHDGVQTNMTNTLNTPIERLEQEYPVLFVKYELRPETGGLGEFRGGLGVVRAFKVTKGKARLVVLAERCRERPWGLEGGGSGSPGVHYVVTRSGSILTLECKSMVELSEGDTVYINTPGGGGYGNPCRRQRSLALADVADEKYRRAYPTICPEDGYTGVYARV